MYVGAISITTYFFVRFNLTLHYHILIFYMVTIASIFHIIFITFVFYVLYYFNIPNSLESLPMQLLHILIISLFDQK